MLAQPAHDRLDRRPDWLVQAVFDPDGGGRDFAYTIGLHERGLPELHLWARPDRGEDPGADWLLSPQDCIGVLHELAWGFVDGTLTVGSEVQREYDDGLAVVHYRIEPPGDRDLLEALGIAPGASVLPVSWSLTRPPEGPLTGLDDATQTRFRREYDEVVGGLRRTGPAPDGWVLPPEPSFDPGQRFGPLTPLVIARAAQLWQADVDSVYELVDAAGAVEVASHLTYPYVIAAARARPVGRREAVEQVRLASLDLVEHTLGRFDLDPSWRGFLLDVVQPVLTVEALADQLDDRWLLHARGCWLAGLGERRGDVPGPAWEAAPHVLDVVRTALSELTFDELRELQDRHEDEWLGGSSPEAVTDYMEVFARLRGLSHLGGAACPWAGCLSELPAWSHVLGALSRSLGRPLTMPREVPLQDWASALAAAITHRALLTTQDVEVFTAPVRDLLPDLAHLLDEPIGA